MTTWEALAVLAAGLGAGTINTIVGSGTLITFPVLLAVGLPPITANVSNSLGLVPGSLSGAFGYRRELTGQRSRILLFGTAALLGGTAGAVLLLALPSDAFDTIVPVLIGIALVLVVIQPRLAAALRARRARNGTTPRRHGGPVLFTGLMLASVYGGYFGAAQGVLYLSMAGLALDETLQRLNALKNVLTLLVNAVAAVLFLFIAHFDWTAVALLATGSALGGRIGATIGRRLPPVALRTLIVIVGVVAIVQLVR
ncbi:sulfite exporter TauE/SafE family protein [Streptomyces benahoarensis]|uniref:Probable membrane transporter protein n=1 Tax=Streptomyces benahoarensis TaxID=2595054 RepID=A0A553Z2V9_9ACTN|nr:sulfite exporter TauE/SafE family protein [Streptomyces benahoarensis]TSB23555.1 sulfite exporter TauE/SafE family protein [Streptomyces benahoarensis]TSB35817.1 sulfite exporter TauE/SafE family protein [Streptomyces benahoarensis]